MSEPKVAELQYFAGIRAFLNPYLFGEIKEIKRFVKINKNKVNEKKIKMRFFIIHTAIETYNNIGQKYIATHKTTPQPFVLFRKKISWRQNTMDALHNFYRTPQSAREEKAPVKLFQIPYYDVERIEHEDGTILWQKKRPTAPRAKKE